MEAIADWIRNADKIISHMSPNKRIIYFCSEDRNIIRKMMNHSLALCAKIDEVPVPGKDKYFEMTNLKKSCMSIEEFFNMKEKDAVICPKCLILRDFQTYDERERTRLFKNFLNNKQLEKTFLLVSSSLAYIPEVFSNEIELVKDGAWSINDIALSIREHVKTKDEKERLEALDIRRIAGDFQGLTNPQITDILDKMGDSLIEDISDGEYKKMITAMRKSEADKDGTIKFMEYPSVQQAEGLDSYMKWLNGKKKNFQDPERARKKGISCVKGVLLCGVPGTGKTLMAKETARILEVPLIKFDISRIQSKNFGESEVRFARYLDRVSAFGSCVMLIDEIEKTFSVNEHTHEVKMSMLGHLLDWLQNRKANVFTFMTANDVQKLPPELIRDERISGRFFLFMPTGSELAAMLKLKLKNIADTDKESFDEAFQESIHGEENNIFRELFDNIAENAEKKSEQGQHCIPFMTGANLNVILESVMEQMEKDYSPPYSFSQFRKSFLKYCDSDSFIPQAQSSMSKLTDMWLFMLDHQYQNASGDLLPFNRFENDHFSKSLPEPENKYDRYYQKVFREEIEKKKQLQLKEKRASAQGGENLDNTGKKHF